MSRSIVFLADQVQDVNIIRPLLALARQHTEADVMVMATSMFFGRDGTGLWQMELRAICGRLGIPVFECASAFEAVQLLQGSHGLLIAAAESNAKAHEAAHEIFSVAPSSFLRVTLQHGFECVGFLHNAAHDRAHGRSAAFNADVICGWFGDGILRSVGPWERAKLIITGPPLLLPQPDSGEVDDAFSLPRVIEALMGESEVTGEQPHRRPAPNKHMRPCLICENLHSVRLGSAILKSGFLAQFTDFAEEAPGLGLEVWLRPHPAGRYTDIKGVALPEGVKKSSRPIYREDLGRFRFAVSAPSSILFDFIVAGIPAAVWQDEYGEIDIRNYPGLPVIRKAEDWRAFAEDAETKREALLAEQQAFLDGLAIPDNVEGCYVNLLKSY